MKQYEVLFFAAESSDLIEWSWGCGVGPGLPRVVFGSLPSNSAMETSKASAARWMKSSEEWRASLRNHHLLNRVTKSGRCAALGGFGVNGKARQAAQLTVDFRSRFADLMRSHLAVETCCVGV